MYKLKIQMWKYLALLSIFMKGTCLHSVINKHDMIVSTVEIIHIQMWTNLQLICIVNRLHLLVLVVIPYYFIHYCMYQFVYAWWAMRNSKLSNYIPYTLLEVTWSGFTSTQLVAIYKHVADGQLGCRYVNCLTII